jgi:DNA polymerase-3 subunit epsilon
MLADLKAPMLDRHDAYSDALMTAMAYVALRDLAERGVRIRRQPLRGAHSFEIG